MKNLLCITIGQSPRDDIMKVMEPFLKNFNIKQRGALDGITKKYIEDNLSPEKNDYILKTKMLDDSYVILSERKIAGLIQDIINEEEKNADVILMLCTGVFSIKFETEHNVIYPQELIDSFIKYIVGDKTLIVINPDKEQILQSQKKWGEIVPNVSVTYASPYEVEINEFTKAAEFVDENDGDIILLDCMGYSKKMKDFFAKATKKSVILSSSLVAKVISELA